MRPTPDALVSFDSAFPTDVRAVRKQMFGMPAGFVNGNMFMGVWDDGVLLRLDGRHPLRVRGLPGIGSFAPTRDVPGRTTRLVSAGRWGDARNSSVGTEGARARRRCQRRARSPRRAAVRRAAAGSRDSNDEVASEEAPVMAARKTAAKKKAPRSGAQAQHREARRRTESGTEAKAARRRRPQRRSSVVLR